MVRGKSTLLRQLTGYLQPDSGECRLFNKPLNEWSITELGETPGRDASK